MKYFEQPIYEQWRQNRLQAIIAHYGKDFFKGKTLLEVGAANGDFGAIFRKMGAIVTSYEGRDQNFQELMEKNPEQNPKQVDLDSEKFEGDYDIILNVGLIYHLFNFENHLNNCMDHCKHLILETEVVDSKRDGYWVECEDSNGDQGANVSNGRITRPNCSYIETMLKDKGFSYEFPKNPKSINTGPWLYDWKRGSINSNTIGLRQMWYCKK